jgi:GDP-mannose 6-dehydrogenase
MKVYVFGLGYVGTIVSVSLARMGHSVTGIDIVEEKVELLRSGQAPFYEPGLQDELTRAVTGRCKGSLNLLNEFETTESPDVAIVCVGTPAMSSGEVDLSQIRKTLELIGKLCRGNECHVVIRSTVPPGTCEGVIIPALVEVTGRRPGDGYTVTFYPEFLREGSAIADFWSPSLNIAGVSDESSGGVIEALFADIEEPVEYTSYGLAEMIKYVNNSFHALKVSFANEIGVLAQAYQVDGYKLMSTFCRDTTLNISDKYLMPGFAFGGSCLPKELKALGHLSGAKGLRLPLVDSILQSNASHIDRLVAMLQEESIQQVLFAGVSFKPATDDLRGSPVIEAIRKLQVSPDYKSRKQVHIHDRLVHFERAREAAGCEVTEATDFTEALESMDAVVLGAQPLHSEEWNALRRFQGGIIDLRWHEVPRDVASMENYLPIC